jgi:uncharacterized membrane protein
VLRKSSFAKDCVLVFFLSFALASLYSKAHIVFGQSVVGGRIYWQTMWQSTTSLFMEYPLVMAINVLVIVVTLLVLWYGRSDTSAQEHVNSKLDTIHSELKSGLGDIKKVLEDIRDGKGKSSL